MKIALYAAHLKNAAMRQMVLGNENRRLHFLCKVLRMHRDIGTADGASFAGSTIYKAKGIKRRGSRRMGGMWRDNGTDTRGGRACYWTKRDKVNSEAHLAVLPSNLAARQFGVKTW